MKITTTPIEGVAIIDLELRSDDRGFFARAFDRQAFIDAGLNPAAEQCNISFNHKAGTLRGMHYQLDWAPETKLVRCTRGAIVDIIVDMRPDSSTYLQHVEVELTADNRRALYVPAMFAHGYQTLVDGTETFYQVSAAYAPGAEGGVRWDDPVFGIEWPEVAERVISEKDRAWPDYPGAEALA
jgi:dTDP-4-dehydrorhamnose 3,5-epimerase